MQTDEPGLGAGRDGCDARAVCPTRRRRASRHAIPITTDRLPPSLSTPRLQAVAILG